jgi:hypothetical protein
MARQPSFRSTRRRFIQTAAAASAAGLWIPRALAAGVGPMATLNTAIELGGATGEWLSSVTLPEHVSVGGAKGEVFGLTPFRATCTVGAPGKVVDWLTSLARGKTAPTDGAVLMTDLNFKVQRRIEWTAGHLTEVKFSKLSAAEGKKPFTADFAWQPATVTHREGAGDKAPALPTASKSQAPMTSNFRLSGLPGDTTFVTSIELPTLSAGGAARKGETRGAPAGLGDLTVEVSSRSRASHYKFVQGVIEDGVLSEKERVDLSVELLDATLTKTLATVRLGGCGLRSYKEDPFERGSEKLGKIAMTFSVQSFELKI